MATDIMQILDAGGARQNLTIERGSGGAVSPHHVPEVSGLPVSPANPLPVSDQPHAITITQTVVALTSADTVIVAANSARKYLLIVNIGTGLGTLGFGGAVVAGQGYPLSAAAAVGDQGGGIERSGDGITQQAIHGICTAGVSTNVCVLEGV